MKKFCILIISCLFLAIFYLFFNHSEQITLVKDAKLPICPDKTIGQMVYGFIKYPTWNYASFEDQHAEVSISGQVLVGHKETHIKIVFSITEDNKNIDLESVILGSEVQLPFIRNGILSKMCAASTN